MIMVSILDQQKDLTILIHIALWVFIVFHLMRVATCMLVENPYYKDSFYKEFRFYGASMVVLSLLLVPTGVTGLSFVSWAFMGLSGGAIVFRSTKMLKEQPVFSESENIVQPTSVSSGHLVKPLGLSGVVPGALTSVSSLIVGSYTSAISFYNAIKGAPSKLKIYLTPEEYLNP